MIIKIQYIYIIMTMLLDFDGSKPIILIDGSYYVFYRYFATMRWFSFQKKEFDVNKITENEEFLSGFLKHMESDLKKICKRWKTDINNITFCTDCQRCKIWRNDIYKDYKGTRGQNMNFNSNIFSIFSEYIQNKGIKKMWFERLEADDVIYLIQNKLKVNCLQNIVIITNDNDYLQLADTNIHIINMQFKDITQRGNKDARSDLLNKAIYGDKSDNIQKIAPFITKEKALQLSKMSDDEIRSWLQENNLIDKFNFNMNLISFEKIPCRYVNDFYNHVNILVY
jgi:5'-3' exonuclease